MVALSALLVVPAFFAPPLVQRQSRAHVRLSAADDATSWLPRASTGRSPLGGVDARVKEPGAPELPPMRVVVAGANGRVGSKVCTELLRNHPAVQVRALVRSADRIECYERLSYEVGAEDGKMDIRPAWNLGENGFNFRDSVRVEFDEAVQGGYGLDRLEIYPCEVRYRADVAKAVAGADCVVYCATTFGNYRTRLPEELDGLVEATARFGANLFELRLPGRDRGAGEDDEIRARNQAAKGATADVEGVTIFAEELQRETERRSRLGMLTGGGQQGMLPGGGQASGAAAATPFVLASASQALRYQKEDDGMGNKETREMEFGYRKRCGEAALRESGIGHRIVRAASIDELLIEEGLEVQGLDEGDLITKPDGEGEEGGAGALATPSDVASRAAGLTQENLEDNRIHPRDIARTLVASLFGAADGRTTEIWTVEESRKDQVTNSNVLFSG